MAGRSPQYAARSGRTLPVNSSTVRTSTLCNDSRAQGFIESITIALHLVALIPSHAELNSACDGQTCAVSAPAVAESIKPPGVASRLLYGERDQTASRTGHTGCACTLRAPQKAIMSRVCPRGLGQAPAMRICSRRTTHRAVMESTSPFSSPL